MATISGGQGVVEALASLFLLYDSGPSFLFPDSAMIQYLFSFLLLHIL